MNAAKIPPHIAHKESSFLQKTHPESVNSPQINIAKEKNSESDEEDEWFGMQECPLSANLVCPLLISLSKQDEEEVVARIKHRANKLFYSSHLSDAEALYTLCKDTAERSWGTEHREVVLGFCNIGTCCLRQGKYHEAKRKFGSAIKLSGILANRGDPDGINLLLKAHAGLATVYLNQNFIQEAEKQINILNSLTSTHFREYDMKTVEPLELRADLYHRIGKYQESVRLYKTAIEVLERHRGRVHEHIAHLLKSLANVLRRLGNHHYAEQYLKLAIEKLVLCKSKSILQHAEILSALGDVYDDQKKFKSAEDLHKEVLRLRESHLGETHPDVGYTLNALGINRLNQELYDTTTEKYFQKAMDIFSDRSFNNQNMKSDINYAASLGNMGILHMKRGDYDRASQYLHQALSIEETLLGSNHPDVANTLFVIAELFTLSRSMDNNHSNITNYEICELYQRILVVCEQSFHDNSHPLFKKTKQLLDKLQVEYEDVLKFESEIVLQPSRSPSTMSDLEKIPLLTGKGEAETKDKRGSYEEGVGNEVKWEYFETE